MIRTLVVSLLTLLFTVPAFAQGPRLRGASLRSAALAGVKREFGDAIPGSRLHYKVLAPAAKYRGPIRNVLVSTAKITARDTHLYNMSNRYSDFTALKQKNGRTPRTKVFGGAQINLRNGKITGGAVG